MVNRMEKDSTKESVNKKDLYINFIIKDDPTKEMFLDIKKFYNLKYNMETFRVMVKKVHDEIYKNK